jgi:hypothetical protein
MGFIQKAVGYSLTGITSEQVLFFVYGKSGNNGKSTAINLFRDMIGDYGCHTPTETLLVKQYDNNIPADLARGSDSGLSTVGLGRVKSVDTGDARCHRRSGPAPNDHFSERPRQFL